jgi:hypothetical protein
VKFQFLGPERRMWIERTGVRIRSGQVVPVGIPHGRQWEFCACGLAFTTYKTHKETKQHKDALKRWRKEARNAATS